jgi:hypothetical protein
MTSARRDADVAETTDLPAALTVSNAWPLVSDANCGRLPPEKSANQAATSSTRALVSTSCNSCSSTCGGS